jgi:hypothetical protein
MSKGWNAPSQQPKQPALGQVLQEQLDDQKNYHIVTSKCFHDMLKELSSLRSDVCELKSNIFHIKIATICIAVVCLLLFFFGWTITAKIYG